MFYDQVSISALPLKYAQWMEIYSYHLAFGVSKGTVWNAYRFMAEGIAHDFVVAHFEKKNSTFAPSFEK